jgi:hypothetical protein
MQYKLYSPAGYLGTDKVNDNIDIHVVTEHGDVFFATLFTPINFSQLMERNGLNGMWVVDMVVVKDLSLETIRMAVDELMEKQSFTEAFCRLGTTGEIYEGRMSYETLISLEELGIR